MAPTGVQTRSTRKRDTLLPWLDQLAQALAADSPGRQRDWTGAVVNVLAAVEQEMRQHLAAATAPDGLFAEVDQTRPTLARQTADICRAEQELTKQVGALRQEVQRAGEAFASPTDTRVGTTPFPDKTGSILDFGDIRRRGEELLAAIRKAREDEAKLILDSVNTDIGVGD